MFALRDHAQHHGDGRHPLPTRAGDGAVATVSVSADVLEDYPQLAGALGAGLTLAVDQPHEAVVAVVGPVGPIGVQFLRAVHPRPALVVVDRGGTDPRVIAASIEAGASSYLTRPTVTEMAARIRSLALAGASLVAG